MRFRRFRRGARKSKYIWFRRRPAVAVGGAGNPFVIMNLFNVAVDLLNTPSAAMEGQDVLLKALRLTVHMRYDGLVGSGATTGVPVTARYGVYRQEDIGVVAATPIFRDPRMDFSGDANAARTDWLDLWSSTILQLPAALPWNLGIDAQDNSVNERHIKVSRRLKTSDNVVLVGTIDPILTATSFGTTNSIEIRAYFSALIKMTSVGL